MQHSTVFAAALKDLWEHACRLKQEKRRPAYFSGGLQLQTGKRLSDGSSNPIIPQRRVGTATFACFMRRSSDRLSSEPRS